MDRPNILLITTDQQRHDALGYNGNPVLQTPHLDELAGSGVNFTRAYSTCPSCIATRRSWLTGLACGNPKHALPGYQDGQEFFPEFTLPSLLGDAGYQTQLVGKYHVYPQGKRYGFDNLILSEQLDHRPGSQYFDRNDYVDWLRSRGHKFSPISSGVGANSHLARPFQLEENAHHTSWCVEEAIRFLRLHRDPSCPWFMHLSFWAPHPPFVPPQVYWDRYAGRDEWQRALGDWTPDYGDQQGIGASPEHNVGPTPDWVLPEAAAGYFGLINHVDDRVQYLINQVWQRGTATCDEPVWIIFTSDHGEMLGDHYCWHKRVPYEGSTHVPMFITGRNVDVPRGVNSDALNGPEDLLPTICELAGVAVPGEIDGRSLAPVVRGEASSVRDALHGEHTGAGGNHWIVSGDVKYCWFGGTGEEQLFNLSDDPRELHDLSGDADKLAPFRERLGQMLAGRDDYTFDPARLTPCAGKPPRAIYDAKD